MELSDQPPRLSASHWLLMLVLAAVQLTHILDFVLLMPLKTHLEDSLRIDTRQFGLVVSAYGLAACLSGLVLARWLDRFDRKHVMVLCDLGRALVLLSLPFVDSVPGLIAASLVLGLMAVEPGADVDALWDAANLEEDWQAELWGKDAEAQDRRARRHAAFAAAAKFALLARG